MFRPVRMAMLCQRASAAVEFALTLPCLVLVLFATIGYGVTIATLHSVQQIAAEAARASIAGLSSQDRETLARTFVTQNIAAYPLLDAQKTTVAVNDGSAPEYAFSVAVTIDLTNSFIYQFRNLLPLPAPQITRSAIIRRGGF